MPAKYWVSWASVSMPNLITHQEADVNVIDLRGLSEPSGRANSRKGEHTMQWFDVDKAGLAKLLARKGKEFVLFELVQNAWDEDTRQVQVGLQRIQIGRAHV